MRPLSKDIESFLFAKKLHILGTLYAHFFSGNSIESAADNPEIAKKLQEIEDKYPGVTIHDLTAWLFPQIQQSEAQKGVFSLVPSAGEEHIIFARVVAPGASGSTSDISTEDLYYCFQRYGFVQASQAEHGAGFYIELESPERALCAIIDTEIHEYVRFVAFKGKTYHVDTLPRATLAQPQKLARPTVVEANVPEIVIDNIPVDVGEAELASTVTQIAGLQTIRWSVNDRTGLHNGCALVRTATRDGVRSVSQALNGALLRGNRLRVGYIDPLGALRDLKTQALLDAPRVRPGHDGRGPREKRPLHCFMCGEPGHKMHECPKKTPRVAFP